MGDDVRRGVLCAASDSDDNTVLANTNFCVVRLVRGSINRCGLEDPLDDGGVVGVVVDTSVLLLNHDSAATSTASVCFTVTFP